MAAGIGFWGPRRTRNGLFQGILPGPSASTCRDPEKRARGRISMNLARSREAGLEHLIISDENMMGAVRANLRFGDLYCGVGERMARYAHAFDGQIGDVIINIRSLDSYWTSAVGYGVSRGHKVPGEAALERLAQSPRSWRDVITDVACAVPGARIWALPFETFGGRPEAQLAAMTGVELPPRPHDRVWLNATPHLDELRQSIEPSQARKLPGGEGRWHPFSEAQTAALRETYADDLMWLAAGADGLANLMQDPDKIGAGRNPLRTDLTRGRPNDNQQRRLAGAG
jgi:hypothetical protein